MSNNQKFVTFGELLLRFSKTGKRRLTQGSFFTGHYGGSEANVAVSLAVLGEQVEYVTRLPESEMGHGGALRLRELGVGTHHILWGGERIGTYYFEEAASVRNSRVIYDRHGSAYAALCPGMIDWRKVLDGVSVLHVSGITAAISPQAAEATFEALDIAEQMGVTIAFDINYRKNLWRYPGADPRKTLSQMLSRADMMFGDAIEFAFITGHRPVNFLARSADYDMELDKYAAWFDECHQQFPRCRKWLMGMRNEISSSHHTLTALLYTDGQLLPSHILDIPGVVDPMGVGDAFMAAFLHALVTSQGNDRYALDYSLAAAALKNSIAGDFNLSTDEEIRQLMEEQGMYIPC
jgi:2-dehydro-3-deoxygluconokinase